VLLLGGAVGGHFLDFYTLPFLPETGGTSDGGRERNRERDDDNNDDNDDDNSGDRNDNNGNNDTDDTNDTNNTYDDNHIPTYVPADDFSYTLLHDLPHAEFHIHPHDPLSGILVLKNLPIPETVTLGLYDSADRFGMAEALFAVSLASDTNFIYEITSYRTAGDGGFVGEIPVGELTATIWRFDTENLQSTPDAGIAKIINAAANSITWEFTLFDGAGINLNDLSFIGYDMKIYHDIIEEGSYYRQLDDWHFAGSMPLYMYLLSII